LIFFDLFKKYKRGGEIFFWGIGLFREKIELLLHWIQNHRFFLDFFSIVVNDFKNQGIILLSHNGCSRRKSFVEIDFKNKAGLPDTKVMGLFCSEISSIYRNNIRHRDHHFMKLTILIYEDYSDYLYASYTDKKGQIKFIWKPYKQ